MWRMVMAPFLHIFRSQAKKYKKSEEPHKNTISLQWIIYTSFLWIKERQPTKTHQWMLQVNQATTKTVVRWKKMWSIMQILNFSSLSSTSFFYNDCFSWDDLTKTNKTNSAEKSNILFKKRKLHFYRIANPIVCINSTLEHTHHQVPKIQTNKEGKCIILTNITKSMKKNPGKHTNWRVCVRSHHHHHHVMS